MTDGRQEKFINLKIESHDLYFEREKLLEQRQKIEFMIGKINEKLAENQRKMEGLTRAEPDKPEE